MLDFGSHDIFLIYKDDANELSARGFFSQQIRQGVPVLIPRGRGGWLAGSG